MTLRPALLAAAALTTAFGTFLVLSRWGAGGNREPVSFAWEVQRGEELAPHIEAVGRRHEARRALAAEVMAGRMTLPEAAGHFRRLDEAEPVYPPGTSLPPRDEWFFCESVLDYVWVVVVPQERYAAAARYYAAAFTAEPRSLAGPPARHRYRAACAAARAGCGQGRDGSDLDEEGRAGFRHQALGWLGAELESWRRLLEQEPETTRWSVAHDLRKWLGDPYFAGVRAPEALARLPAAERQEWHQLWTDVADTLARAEGTMPPEQKAGSTILLPDR
jgi:hypothetical protein